MVYLIKSAGYSEDEGYLDLLKVGYTADYRKDYRFMAYRMHNPTCQVLYEIPNLDEDIEKRIQYKFRDLLYPHYGREWFWFDRSIIDFFEGIGDVDLESLPKNPNREDKDVREERKEGLWILGFVLEFKDPKHFNSNEEILKSYYKPMEEFLGDLISRDTILDYLRNDPSITSSQIQRYLDYEERVRTGIYTSNEEWNREVLEFFKKYDQFTTRYDKMKFFCEYSFEPEVVNIILAQIPDSDEIKSYYLALGPEKLKSLGYDITRIRKELGVVIFDESLLRKEIFFCFKEGDKVLLSDMKERLGMIYRSVGYGAKPKAKDIENYFETRLIYVYIIDEGGKKKQTKAYELLRKKD